VAPAAEIALRRVCVASLALPEGSERVSHGAATFFVRGRTIFVTFHDDHHGSGRLALWVAAPPGAQQAAVDEESVRFFRPPYVGHRGWLGVRLDRGPDWDEVVEIVMDAYRTVAPRKLVALLGEGLD
jgi:hypothetical protein